MLGVILLIIGLMIFSGGCVWWFVDWDNIYPIALITIGILMTAFGAGIGAGMAAATL